MLMKRSFMLDPCEIFTADSVDTILRIATVQYILKPIVPLRQSKTKHAYYISMHYIQSLLLHEKVKQFEILFIMK